MITDFRALTIPEGEVVKIEDSLGNVLWQKLVFYDYLQGDGVAYVNTNYKIKYYDSIKVKISVLQASTQNRMVFMGYYVANGNSVTAGFSFNTNSVNNRWFNRKLAMASMSKNTIYEFTYSKDGYSGDINRTFEEELDVPSNTTLGGNLTLVRLSTMSESYTKGVVKLYYTQIFNGQGTLVRNFIPCTYQGEPGLWDSVENKFYGNANSTGAFSVGNDS